MKTKHLLISSALGLGLALALLWLLDGTHVAHANPTAIIYVSTTGADGPACGTVASPCRTIPYAVDNRAQSGDTVSVAAGTYTETFVLKAGVVISGAGAGVTIVDGEDVRGPMVTADGAVITGSAVLCGLTIRRGNSASGGGGMTIINGATPTIEDCAIQENTAIMNGGGVRIYNNAAPTFSNTQVLNNSAGGHGGGVYAWWYCSPTIAGGQVANNSAADAFGGGGLYIGGNSALAISNTQVVSNSAANGSGGGYYIYSDASVTILGGEVRNNTAASWYGGGLHIYDGSSVTISGTRVISNYAANSGAGVAVNYGSSAIITGAQVSSNTTAAGSGGGVWVNQDSMLTFNGGRVQGNEALSGEGGGFEVAFRSTVLLSDTQIISNAASWSGGGIRISDRSQGVLTNLHVLSNTAQNGGGVQVTISSTPTIVGGEVRGNTASNSGGGIHVTSSSFPIIEGVVVRDNQALGAASGSGGGGFYVTGNSTPLIRDTLVLHNEANGSGGGYFISASATIIGGEVRDNTAASWYGGGFNVYGGGSVAISGTRVISNYAANSGAGVAVNYGSSAIITGAQVSSNTTGAGSGGGVWVNQDSVLTFNGGRVQGNEALAGEGGGFEVAFRSTALISGTQVVSNTAAWSGGGIRISDRSQGVLTNLHVLSNTAQNGGGVQVTISSTPTIVGGEVRGNTASNSGGGIHVTSSCSPIIEGVVVRDNRALGASSWTGGGGFYVTGNSAPVIKDTQVVSNSAAHSGGGYYIYSAASATVLGGEVRNNTAASRYGGGFYVYDGGSATISGTLVSSNDAANRGGGVAINYESSAIITGAQVMSNTAGDSGGGVWVNQDCALIFSGGRVQGNEATSDNGGGFDVTFRSTALISSVQVLDNRDGRWCGGIYLHYIVTPTIHNCVVAGNTHHGMRVESSVEAVTVTRSIVRDNDLDGIYLFGGHIELANSVIAHNAGNGLRTFGMTTGLVRHNTVADNGGNGVSLNVSTTLDLINTIVSGHGVGVNVAAGSVATLESTLWDGNGADTGGAGTINTNNDYTGDPAFAGGGDYHITAGSEAIDKGVDAGVATDIDGEARDANPDIGADEWYPCIALTGVGITGLMTTTVQASHTFTAMVSPITATIPITYAWQATGQVGEIHVGVADDTVSFTWAVTGTKRVTVTAVNECGVVVSAVHTITVEAVPCDALDEVSIGGPTTTTVGIAATFTATAGPPDAAQPVTYTWRVSESASQRIITHTGGLSDTAVFTWNMAGPQVVTVTAVNECGVAVSKLYTITVEAVPCIGLDEVGIGGPTSGYTGTLYAFTSVITPTDATEPITYTWSPAPVSGQGMVSATYQWAAPGVHVITLTAENCGGPVSATHTITIESPPPSCPHPLEDVGIKGPTSGYTDTLYAFTSVITPTDATEPITYTWSPAPVSGQGAVSATYQWAAPGVHVITLTAENCGGPVSATHTITIESPPPGCPHPLEDVGIKGPTGGYTDTLYPFTSVITPSDATEPITYTWSPGPESGQGTDGAGYRWATPGVHVITLTAENCGGSDVATRTITIGAGVQYRIYLPLVLSSVEGLVVRGQGGLVLSKAEGLVLKKRAPALDETAVVTETVTCYEYDFAGNNPAGGIPR